MRSPQRKSQIYIVFMFVMYLINEVNNSFLFFSLLLCINIHLLTLVLLNADIPCFANSVDPYQLASEEAN